MTVSKGLLERSAELENIGRHLDAAVDGQGSFALVEGPSGIGKTSLLREAKTMARSREMLVLDARAGALETDLDWSLVAQLLERPLFGASEDERDELLSGPARAAGWVIGLEVPDQAEPGRENRDRMFRAIYWLFSKLSSRQPLMIVIDDIQWGDRTSLECVTFLTQRLDSMPVVVLAGLRTDDPYSRSAEVAEMIAANRPESIAPPGLSGEACESMLAEAFETRSVPPNLVDHCVEATGGNPFYLTELIRGLSARFDKAEQVEAADVTVGPPAVRRAIALNLDKLGESAKALASAVSVLGGEAELRYAALIAGLDDEEAANAADALTLAGIFDGGRPLRIKHSLIQAAISDEVSESARAAAHREALNLLAGEGAPDDMLVVHALLAEPSGDQATVALLRRTAARAFLIGSPQVATTHLDRAMMEPPVPDERPYLQAELGRAQVRSGQFTDGIASLTSALSQVDDLSLRQPLHRDRIFAAFASEGLGSAAELVSEAFRDLGADDSDSLQLEVDLTVFAWLSNVNPDLDLWRHADVQGNTSAERSMLALLAQECQRLDRSPDEVADFARRALAGGRLIDEDSGESLAWYMATMALTNVEEFEVAKASVAHCLADSRSRGSVFGVAAALALSAMLALGEGRPRDAEADARTSLEGTPPPSVRPVAYALLVRALIEQGRLDDAQSALVEGGLEVGPGGPTILRMVPWCRALLHQEQGDLEAVKIDLEPIIEDERIGRSIKGLQWRVPLSRALAAAGRPDEARPLAERHLEWATRWGRAGVLGTAQRNMALVGEAGSRRERLEAAIETLAASSLKTEEAKARVDLGLVLARQGEKQAGVEQLEAGLEIALERGARGTATVAARELELLGSPSRKVSFDELTPSERRIAEMAADGATNREIAEDLFVAVKTVENHLSRAYVKLGINSRRDLRSALGEEPAR